MKHITYHGNYKKRSDLERDMQERLPKRATVIFAHKESATSQTPRPHSHGGGMASVFSEKLIVLYELDKRFYSCNGKRIIIDKETEGWKFEQQANIDPEKALPHFEPAMLREPNMRSFLEAVRDAYRRMAALREAWEDGREPEPDELPKITKRLGNVTFIISQN